MIFFDVNVTAENQYHYEMLLLKVKNPISTNLKYIGVKRKNSKETYVKFTGDYEDLFNIRNYEIRPGSFFNWLNDAYKSKGYEPIALYKINKFGMINEAELFPDDL
jgi:hypothetical protein